MKIFTVYCPMGEKVRIINNKIDDHFYFIARDIFNLFNITLLAPLWEKLDQRGYIQKERFSEGECFRTYRLLSFSGMRYICSISSDWHKEEYYKLLLAKIEEIKKVKISEDQKKEKAHDLTIRLNKLTDKLNNCMEEIKEIKNALKRLQ